MNFLKHAFLIIAAVLSLNAYAREPVPIINYDNIPVATASGKPLAVEQVKQAILVAAATKNWSVEPQADDHLLAMFSKQGKHTISVAISYTTDKYSLNYSDSTNMKFGEREGQLVIHPFYNKWVQNLKEAIRIELLKI